MFNRTGPDVEDGGRIDPEIADRLARIEQLLGVLVERQQVRDFYSIDEFARMVGKSEFTCREYARLGRINAQKRQSGRGPHASWVVSHAELLRFQRDGLLPQHK